MTGATRSMSSRQWRGGGGSSSGANVSLISRPQTLHRYRTFTLRISPEGGGGGSGVVGGPPLPGRVVDLPGQVGELLLDERGRIAEAERDRIWVIEKDDYDVESLVTYAVTW